MTAVELVAALGGRWHGSYGTARCVAHEDVNPSLSISDGEDGRTLLKCHAGCSQEAVQDALRARGLWGGDTYRHDPQPAPARRARRCDDDVKRTEAALLIWQSGAPAIGSPVEAYLRARSITIPPPPSLRYVQACKYGPSGIWLPAMVAAVQAPDRRVVAVHRTYLDPSGTRKAQVHTPKMALGPIGDGAVRLAAAGARLGLAEGIETALSAMQLFGIPCWAALGARMDKVVVPFTVEEVTIFADNGGPGREAAEKAAARFTSEGRAAVLRFPPEGDGDWNDTLRGMK